MLARHLHISNQRILRSHGIRNSAKPVRCSASSLSSACPTKPSISWLPCWGKQQRSSSNVARVAQRPLSAILSDIEDLKSSADALEEELSSVSTVAEVAAKRSRRLAARSHELQEYALEHVLLGDEPAARAALQQKAAVAVALRQASHRAEANSALARKLEEVLMLKHNQLLTMIREANRQQAAATASRATAPAPQGAAKKAGARGLKRSRSVAWSSSTLHASSDGFTEAADLAAAAAAAVAAVDSSLHEGRLRKRHAPNQETRNTPTAGAQAAE